MEFLKFRESVGDFGAGDCDGETWETELCEGVGFAGEAIPEAIFGLLQMSFFPDLMQVYFWPRKRACCFLVLHGLPAEILDAATLLVETKENARQAVRITPIKPLALIF